MKNKKCYMCDEIACSDEHVPPRCIFPERKDIQGKDYRHNLITVPSCDIHNSKKSKDDEFLMVSLAGIIGNNSVGYLHKFTKVDRAIKNSANRLIESVFLKKEKYYFKIEDNKFIELIWGTPDRQRLENCFEHIAFGIYYHHFKERFRGKIRTLLGYLHNNEKNPANFAEFIKHKVQIELAEKVKFGNNQDIFFYQFTEKDEYGLFLLRLCFYEGLDIFISFMPEGIQLPGNLAMELINIGIETYIELDGKSYKFN